MKRFLLFVMMCVCVSIGTWADVSIREGSTADEVIVEVTGDSYGQFASHSFTTEELALLDRAKLTLVGKFNDSDLQKFRDQGKNHATTVNFWDAEFESHEASVNADWDGNNNWYNKTVQLSDQSFKYFLDATTIVLSDKETGYFTKESMFQSFNGNVPPIANVTFAGAIDVPNNLFDNRSSLQSVTFSSKVTGIGAQAFKGCQNLENVDFGTDCHITTIGKEAFDQAGKAVLDDKGNPAAFPKQKNGRLEIPNSVVTIKEKAFQECPIKTLVINEGSHLQTIESRAFFYEQGPLNEVYVNKTDATIACAPDAFDDTHTDGHTDVATAKTRLYYPENFFDHYVGNWKEPAMHGIINQANLQTLDDIVKQGKTIDGVQYGPTNNGWHMFVSSGIAFTDKTTWRTYSTVVSFKVPEEDHVKTYLVCGYDKDNSLAKLVQMKEGETIPANTGVLFHYVHPENATFSSVVPIVKVESTLDRYDDQLFPNNKYSKGGKSYANYLRKINRETITVANVEVENGVKTYRNFLFANGTQLANSPSWQGNEFRAGVITDWGFFRAKTKEYTINNKAYLHLPASLCGADNVTGNINGGSGAEAKSCGLIIIDGDLEEIHGIATGLQIVKQSKNDDGFYTIQGMKVSKPTVKGLYIYNGKKILIK